MTTTQISMITEDIYGFEISQGMVSDITDKLLPVIEDWHNRPLSAVYPIVFINIVNFLSGMTVLSVNRLYMLCLE